MTMKTKVKDSERSPLIISFNWKEEMMLKKRLNTLESMKKQVEAYYSLDQRILYNRFQIKLKRSELAHARQMDNKDLLQQLKTRAFSFNTTVVDDNEKAVRQIVKMAARERSRSAGYSNTRGSASRQVKSACGTQIHSQIVKDRERAEQSVKGNNQQEDAERTYAIPERKNSGKRVAFLKSRPHTSSNLPSLKESLNARPHTALVTLPADMEMLTKSAEPITECKDEGSNTAKGNMATSVAEENIVSVKNGKVHVNPKIKKQDSKGSLLSTIGEEKTTWPMVMQPVASRKLDFGDKMTLFVDRVKDLKQQQCTALSDYYSERLQESLNSSKQKIRDVALQSAMEEEHGKWLLVGKEMDSRSITVKPLEWDFSQKDVSAEVLFLDSYSAVITKENREERNWIDNNPHCTTFNVTSVNDQTPRDPCFTRHA